MNPQLLLALGDFSYEKTATCWLNLIKPVDSITKINIGNHEGESDGLTYYIPEPLWSFKTVFTPMILKIFMY